MARLITNGAISNILFFLFFGIPLVISRRYKNMRNIIISRLHGNITNYSMGISAYTCFIMVAVYILAAIVILFTSWHQLGHHKLITVSTYVFASIVVTCYQMFHPQALISCIVPTPVIVGTYLNMENPVFTKLLFVQSTCAELFCKHTHIRGGPLDMTARIVITVFHKRRKSHDHLITVILQLTGDYIKNLVMAAPMHDVGKIAIPDAILQKPGKLTSEKFDIMKTHAARGGKIIRETFGHLGDDEYEKMAYEVARHHHEKWNGRGYPDGLSQKEIPLSARIMAVADVFDAVSAKRCYRDALPLEECFRIIENGSGQDFDPVIAGCFLT